jgi:hypothetical protein
MFCYKYCSCPMWMKRTVSYCRHDR